MGRLLKLATVLLLTISCGQQQHNVTQKHTRPVFSLAEVPIVSTVVSTSTTLPRASRSAVRNVPKVVTPKASYVSVMPDDFWWRLSHNCECSGGSGCANSGGWFQFKGGTVKKVGYFVGATYDQQLGMAKWWLIQIKGHGGGTGGWPVCWWRAL